MTETNNLKLSLPGSSDYVDVNVLNENFKKIDAKAVHASSHSTGGSDPITPASIGAAPNVSSSVELYVSKSGNDDTGDGTAGNPYLTIQKAVDSAPRVHCDLKIYIGAGTYDESVLVYALSNISVRAQDSANKPIVKSLRFMECANASLSNIIVNGVYDETYRAAVYVDRVAKMYMEGVVCTENDKSQSAYGGGIRFNGGIGRLTKCEISNKYTALSAVGSVVFLDKNCTGANNTNALVSGDGYGNTPAAIFKGTSTISGAEVMGFGGKIW